MRSRLAAALSGRYEYSRICAVVSGGNLDSSAFDDDPAGWRTFLTTRARS